MTNITRVIKDLIEANTYAEITANVGNTEPVTIDSIVYADQTWANTSNTSVPVTGGYIKLYGKSFEPNANILFGSTTSTSNVISNNEIQVSVPALATGTYTLFLYNPSGSNAIKYKSIPVQGDFNYGWFSGGTTLSSVERIDFNNDTVNTNFRATLPLTLVYASSAGTNDNAYIFGGSLNGTRTFPTPANDYFSSQVIRITYANDESSPLNRVGVSPATQRFRTTVASKNYAYTSGGLLSTILMNSSSGADAVSNTDRLDFSNDSASLTTKGPLSIAKMKFSSVSNDDYGWYIGGSPKVYSYDTSPRLPYSTTLYSFVDRLNFNSDTTTTVVRGPLGAAKSFAAVTKNTDYAWIATGVTSHSFIVPSPAIGEHILTFQCNVERMTFSNDNLQATVRVPIASNFAQVGAGNEDYGWFTGGIPSASPPSDRSELHTMTSLSNITRLTYASDTTAAANRSSFFQSRKFHTGNSGVVS